MVKNDYVAGWFCGGFYNAERLCSESPTHRGCTSPGSGGTEAGGEGTDTIMHIQPCGNAWGKNHGAVLQEVTVFSAAQNPYCAPWMRRGEKGFKLTALKSKEDVWAREKGAILKACEDPKRIKIWRLGAFCRIIAGTALSSQYLCLHSPLQNHTSSSP